MSTSEPLLSVDRLTASWGSTPVLRSVTLEVHRGEYFVLLGPNGSGKSTLLRTIVGLEAPTGGRIRLAGSDITDLPTHRRGIGLMFQEPALFAHRTVYENIAYAPLLQRRPRAEVDETVGRMVQLLRLDGFEDRPPNELSGGERQRVALARTLAARPRLVLLDEPFASIDPELKQELRTEFRRVLATLGTAAIHVTHDREEGLFLGDRVGVLFDGALEVVGPPSEVFDHPTTARTAQFLGYNIVRTTDGIRGVHPNDLRLAAPGTSGALPLIVIAVGSVGRETVVVLRADDGSRLEARSSEPVAGLSVGQRVGGTWARSLPLSESRAS